MSSLKTSLRNTGWSRHTCKTNLSLLLTSSCVRCFLFVFVKCISNPTVSATEHSRLHSCWRMGIIFSRSESFKLLHLGYPAGLVYEGRRLLFANLKEAIKNKSKEVTIEAVQKSIAQWKKRLSTVRKQKRRRDSAHFLGRLLKVHLIV